MNENEVLRDDEISFFDLWEKLRDSWKTVAGGVVLGAVGALAGIVLIPPKYEAVAVVQVGQVGQVGQIKVSGQPVETPIQAVERMKTPAFQRRVAEALGDQEWLEDISQSSSGVTKDLTLQLIKATATSDVPLIELRATASNPEAAQRKADGAVGQLIKIHAELAQPALIRMRSDLAIAREKLASAERDLELLKKLVMSASVKDDRFTQLALMTSLRIQKEAETYGQRQIIMAMETALEPPATLPAKTIEAVYSSDKAVSPKKTLFLVLGLIGGLLIGVIWVFVGDAWRKARTARRG